jgi:class 3 adenylate cyclase
LREIHVCSTTSATGAFSGERRQVTVLFYDIVGSTALLHQLDPEEFAGMQRMLHNEAAARISGNNGYLERIQGDGGCAYLPTGDNTDSQDRLAAGARYWPSSPRSESRCPRGKSSSR